MWGEFRFEAAQSMAFFRKIVPANPQDGELFFRNRLLGLTEPQLILTAGLDAINISLLTTLVKLISP
jgi:hypothetical protein